MIVGLESNSKIFTVAVQGLLELQVSRLRRISSRRFRVTAVPCPSPAGWTVHLHICGQRGRCCHHHPEWVGLHGNAAGCVEPQRLQVDGENDHGKLPRRFEGQDVRWIRNRGGVENSEDCFLRCPGD